MVQFCSFNAFAFLISSIVVFYLSYQQGLKRHVEHHDSACQSMQALHEPQLLKTEATGSDNNQPCLTNQPVGPVCHDYSNQSLSALHAVKGATAESVFPHLKHPTSPSKWSFFVSQGKEWDQKKDFMQAPCEQVYLTRTGSFANQPNKCVSVVVVPEGYNSITQLSHRKGVTALKTDQYQEDYPREYGKSPDSEQLLLLPFLQEYDRLVKNFLSKMGNPIDESGQRKTAIVMVANEGVMDLLLNFMCSAEEIHLDLKSIVVFVGDEKSITLIENMGANAIYDPALGSMPAHAAKIYLDDTFARIMWFKTTSVYLALTAGFNVLFQDVDLVWLKNPFKYLNDLNQDMVFMDDGQISPRYTPYYVNSGFYFVKHNERTLYLFEKMIKGGASEIGRSHSHQQVLIRHIAESHHLFGLQVFVLNRELFPSGQTYHENKKLVKKIQEKTYRPYVFHMCWTDNRENKIVYFKDVGLWYLPDKDPVCSKGSDMFKETQVKRVNIRDRCCQRDRYWPVDEEQGEKEEKE
jgi:hypothetical protein